MRMLSSTFALSVLMLAGATAPLGATDFKPLMGVVKETWPTKGHIGVVADYQASKQEIANLADAAGEGNQITVYDIRSRTQLVNAAMRLRLQFKPDYMVLLPNDPLVGDGSPLVGQLVGMMAMGGTPTVGTTARCIQKGAVFALGEGTGMELLVTDKLIGTVEVILPKKGSYLPTAANTFKPGSVTVVAVR